MKKSRLFCLAMASLCAISVILLTGCSKNEEDDTATVKDIDGNSYTVITIGTQQWIKENLRTTKFNDGSAVPNVTDNAAWEALTTPGFAWWENNSAGYKIPYGAYYNWWAAASDKLCPTGWHVPDDADWTALSDFLGGTDFAGGKMKEKGTTHWIDPNSGATNSSDFTAIGNGQRSYNGNFSNMGEIGQFWSTTDGDDEIARFRALAHYDERLFNAGPGIYKDKKTGLAVRCVKN